MSANRHPIPDSSSAFPHPSIVPTLAELNCLSKDVQTLQTQTNDHVQHMKKVLKKMMKTGQWRKEWDKVSHSSTTKIMPKSELKSIQVELITKIQHVRHEMTMKLQDLESKLSDAQHDLIAKRSLYISELRRQLLSFKSSSSPSSSPSLSTNNQNMSKAALIEMQLLTGAAYTSNELDNFLNEQLQLYDLEVSEYQKRLSKPAEKRKELKKIIRSELEFVSKSLSTLLNLRKTRAELVENSILFDYSYETPYGHSQGSTGGQNLFLPTIGMSQEELQVVSQFQSFVRTLTKEGLAVRWSDIERHDKLGEGAYSVVESGWCSSGPCQGRLVAIKFFKSTRTASLQAWMREVEALRACSNNPHAIRLLGICAESKEKLCIITPLYKGGSIHDAIYKNDFKFPMEQALQIAKDIAEGMKQIHAQKLIHRDLTPTNILLHPDVKGKSFIADFGIAIASNDTWGIAKDQDRPKSPRGHPRYKAPEIVTKDPYDCKIDVWQFGTIVYILFSNRRPFESQPDREQMDPSLENTVSEAPNVSFSVISPTRGSKNFYLFGTPIQQSFSPLLHNTAFKHYNLPYEYHLCETDDADFALDKLRESGTKGGSVTIPLKEKFVEEMDYLSEAAELIGAVNTVTRDEFGDLHGDNTDWIAMFNLIKESSEGKLPASDQPRLGLVLGAGGTSRAACYSLNKLSITPLIWNRTIEKADDLAESFEGKVVSDLASLDPSQISVIISTLPPTAECPLPEGFVQDHMVLVDVSYHTKPSELLLRGSKIGNSKCVTGIEILLEQALHQFELFVGKTGGIKTLKAPSKEMATALIEKLIELKGDEFKANMPNSFKKYGQS